MPAPSPNNAGRPSGDSVFAASGDIASEVTRIADGDAHDLEALRQLDPDQIDGARPKKRLGLFFWFDLALRRIVSSGSAPMHSGGTFSVVSSGEPGHHLPLDFFRFCSAALSALPLVSLPATCEARPKQY